MLLFLFKEKKRGVWHLQFRQHTQIPWHLQFRRHTQIPGRQDFVGLYFLSALLYTKAGEVVSLMPTSADVNMSADQHLSGLVINHFVAINTKMWHGRCIGSAE